jgi:hypothetical protein
MTWQESLRAFGYDPFEQCRNHPQMVASADRFDDRNEL